MYRKGMLDSPAYRLNHEEITKSLEEGIAFVERMNPEEAIPDAFGHVSAVRFREQINENGKWRDGDAVVTLPARSVFVAAGTTPNVTYEREYPGTFQMDERRRFFKPHVAERARRRRDHPRAGVRGVLHVVQPGRQVRHLLRRQSSQVRRQRRQGDGLGARWIPARGAAVPRGREGRAGERGGGARGGMAAVHGPPRR